MPRYEVQHRYSSNDFGPWIKGDQITLDNVEDAEYVNRDSPGTLVEIDPEEAAAKKRDSFARQQEALEQRRAAKASGGRATGKL